MVACHPHAATRGTFERTYPMIPTTLTQLMGNPPVAARRRGPGAVRRHAAHRPATRPFAGTTARCTATGLGNWVLASGYWVESMVATFAIKRPARHLATRTT